MEKKLWNVSSMGERVCLKKHTYQKDTHMSITNQMGTRRLVNIAKVALETGSGVSRRVFDMDAGNRKGSGLVTHLQSQTQSSAVQLMVLSLFF